MNPGETRREAAGPERGTQRGVALIAVLWVVAALSILVTGLVQTQREEIRSAVSARIRLQADAVGQGAIHVAVQTLNQQSQRRERLARIKVPYDGVEVIVEVQPFSGLVDVNLAPPPLLAALFSVNGGLDVGAATRLAASVVALRDARPAG
ncbi:MAG: general secretion pathway protein GspK, partial [Ramlibacter sp.]|nr:general secretion pathway protein GspK [Ramlibacter sp.]